MEGAYKILKDISEHWCDDSRGYCFYCQKDEGHEEDCIYVRASEWVNSQTKAKDEN